MYQSTIAQPQTISQYKKFFSTVHQNIQQPQKQNIRTILQEIGVYTYVTGGPKENISMNHDSLRFSSYGV